MNSWPITPMAAPRATRATSGTVDTTSAITAAQAGAEDGGHRQADQDGREGQHDVDQPHDPGSRRR
jgi:hypothetical protein